MSNARFFDHMNLQKLAKDDEMRERSPNANSLVDELAQIRDAMRTLKEREAFVRNEIIRTGRSIVYGQGSVATIVRSDSLRISGALAKEKLDAETLASIQTRTSITTVKVAPIEDIDAPPEDIF